MPALALLALLGGGYGAGALLNKQAMDSPELEPEIAGMQSQLVVGGLGLLAMLLGGPIFGALGAGALIGSSVSYDGVQRVKAGLEKMIEAQITAQLTDGGGGDGRKLLEDGAALLEQLAP